MMNRSPLCPNQTIAICHLLHKVNVSTVCVCKPQAVPLLQIMMLL